jgi:hypothetical protein
MRRITAFNLKVSGSAMPLLAEARKKTKQHRSNKRALWITAIVLDSILILLAILLASIDDYRWLAS